MTRAPVRLALLAASPVHYQAPLYRQLARDPQIDFTAIFASSAGLRPYDGGYGQEVKFADDVLDGYQSLFLRNADSNTAQGGVLALRNWDVASLLRRERYDVLWLHGYHTITHMLAATTQRVLGGALMFREEQTLLEARGRVKTAVKRLTMPLYFRGVHAVPIGTENRRWWRHWRLPPERLFLAPYAVDNHRLREEARRLAGQRLALRRGFGIADDAGPVILSVSRLIAKKDPLVLIEAFRHLRAGRRCSLLVVGSGELEDTMRARVAAHGIPDVTFAGFLSQDELPCAYGCADVFALPSREHETWGLVVNEAMNFGLPVVVSRKVGCAADLVRPGETGLVVNPGDAVGLGEALARLTDSESLRQTLGSNGQALIAHWTIERAAGGIVRAATAAATNGGA